MKLLKFGIVGATGMGVNLSVFTLAKLLVYSAFGQTDLVRSPLPATSCNRRRERKP